MVNTSPCLSRKIAVEHCCWSGRWVSAFVSFWFSMILSSYWCLAGNDHPHRRTSPGIVRNCIVLPLKMVSPGERGTNMDLMFVFFIEYATPNLKNLILDSIVLCYFWWFILWSLSVARGLLQQIWLVIPRPLAATSQSELVEAQWFSPCWRATA